MKRRKGVTVAALAAVIAVVSLAGIGTAGATTEHTTTVGTVRSTGSRAAPGTYALAAAENTCRVQVHPPLLWAANDGADITGYAKVVCDLPVTVITIYVVLTRDGYELSNSANSNFGLGEYQLEQNTAVIPCVRTGTYQVLAEVAVTFLPNQTPQVGVFNGGVETFLC